MKPFRWNLKKREQLGTLLDIDAESTYADYEAHLVDCASKVVARSNGKKIIFVGRSPENIFDYISGIVQKTTFEESVDILNISNRFREVDDIRN